MVGGSGLLGRHTYALARRSGHHVHREPVPWLGEAGDVLTALRSGIDRTVAAAGHRRLNIVWAAGAGVVGTSEEDLERERQFYTAFLARLLEVTDQSIRSQLSLFLASSAGALYAGSGPPPFTETSDIRPLSPYGHSKLAMERASTNFAERSGVRVVIGRISNLYGPGQNLAKQQGLISQLARSYLVAGRSCSTSRSTPGGTICTSPTAPG